MTISRKYSGLRGMDSNWRPKFTLHIQNPLGRRSQFLLFILFSMRTKELEKYSFYEDLGREVIEPLPIASPHEIGLNSKIFKNCG